MEAVHCPAQVPVFGYKANGDARRTLHLQLPNEAGTEVGEYAILIHTDTHTHRHTHTHTHTQDVFLILSRTRETVIGIVFHFPWAIS